MGADREGRNLPMFIGCKSDEVREGHMPGSRAGNELAVVLGILLVASLIFNIYMCIRERSRSRPSSNRNPGDVEEESVPLPIMSNGVAPQAAAAATPHRGEPEKNPGQPETTVEMTDEQIQKATVDEANMTVVDEDQLLYDERGVNHGNEAPRASSLVPCPAPSQSPAHGT